MNSLSYLDYFYLSLFSKKQSKKTSTIYHILTGKKTASILYGAEKYDLTYFFALFPKLKRSQFNKSIDKLVCLNYLSQSKENKEFSLSNSGEKEWTLFFDHHHYPKQLNYLQDGLALIHFWRTIQLITQVLSEVRYKNKQYTPIEKEWEKQQWLKQWLKNNNANKQELAVAFGNEWILIMSELPLLYAEILTDSLSGHNKTGKTQKQLAEAHRKEAIEVHLIILDSLACIGKIIDHYPEKTPLFSSIYKEMIQTYDGTTKSALLTKHYLLAGYSLEDTIKHRQLKPSTINEHVIEISIMDPLFDLSTILPVDKFKEIKQLLKEVPALTYQEMLEKKPEVLFLWFRLAQIERNRNSDE
ncbi:MAG: helix-turn-helix domain-containing protein [Carnobacterium sp.]|nr:helix-turn-helix domain-containing protein [Carnobacterium sp.]